MPLAHRSSTDTPSGLRGLESLKGSDRVVGRLLYDAMRCTRDIQQAPDLAALCADTPRPFYILRRERRTP